MVDLQRFELEKKRYRRESVSIFIAALALAVSGGTAGFAIKLTLDAEAARAQTTSAYLTALTSTGMNDALGALAYADSDSRAAKFANTASKWRQAQKDASATSIKAGSVTQDGEKYRLCLPQLSVPLFDAQCVTIANIDYSPEGKVRDFTVDKIPVSSLVRPVKDTDLTDQGSGPMRVHLDAAVLSPDGASETLVYRLDRRRERDRRYPVTFSKLILQNDLEKPLTVKAQHFPTSVGYWQETSAVVQAPRETAFLMMCWSGLADNRGGCDWTSGTGMN